LKHAQVVDADHGPRGRCDPAIVVELRAWEARIISATFVRLGAP